MGLSFKLVKTSYRESDVIVLLKDLTAVMNETSTFEREQAIQSGVHYSEMLPEENQPSNEYITLYKNSMTRNKIIDVAMQVGVIADEIYRNSYINSGNKPVIISLARAGTPIGILVKRWILQKYSLDCTHYSISIIRDKGIDINAMKYIHNIEVKKKHNSVSNFFFIDGWTGKGEIKKQLKSAVNQLSKSNISMWKDLSSKLYVLADPANVADYCGTKRDYLVPCACFNSTISGLFSRTILNNHIDVNNGEFHGAVYFEKFKDIDMSNQFIDEVSSYFNKIASVGHAENKSNSKLDGMHVVSNICNKYDISDYRKVKPGIGETTRVLLRRVPWKVLINTNTSMKDADIQHILELCKEKKIPIEKYNLGNYKVCGIIKELGADA